VWLRGPRYHHLDDRSPWVALPQPVSLEHPLSQAEPQRELEVLSGRPGGLRLLSSSSGPRCLRITALRVASQLLSRKIDCSAAPGVLSSSGLDPHHKVMVTVWSLAHLSYSHSRGLGHTTDQVVVGRNQQAQRLFAPDTSGSLTRVRHNRLNHWSPESRYCFSGSTGDCSALRGLYV